MKRAERGQGAGYTILETMIFLAVSAAMFVSAMAFINGRQNRTEFASAVRDFESSINDLANDVSTGYYANTTDTGSKFYCSISGGQVSLTRTASPVGTQEQGANLGCIFIGKALQFRSSTEGADKYLDITLVGRQYKGGSASLGDSQNYQDSGVKAVAKSSDASDISTPNAYGKTRLGGGVTVGCVLYIDAPTVPADFSCSDTKGMTAIDTVAFLTTFQAANLSYDKTKAGDISVNLVVPASGLQSPTQQRTVPMAVDDLNKFDSSTATITNPKGGVFVCLQSNGTSQHAWISLGGQDSRFSTDTTITGGGC